MRGASAGVLCLLQEMLPTELQAMMSGWFDSAIDEESRCRLRYSLAGAIQVLLHKMQNDSSWLDGIEERLLVSNDATFLQRLPPLRGAFHEFSPADRERILIARIETYADRTSIFSDTSADDGIEDVHAKLAMLHACDLAGKNAVLSFFPDLAIVPANFSQGDTSSVIAEQIDREANYAIGMADRWRMILGVPPESLSQARTAAECLDQLYGRGRGEGSRGSLARRRKSASSSGGTEAPQPTVAEWADELEELFGSTLCQEILGESAASGNLAAVEAIDPDSVTPSMALLQNVLSLAGGLPEHRTEHLRKIAKRITEQLAKQLEVRLRISMSGLSTMKPTRRRTRRLNLPRTIRDNLVNAYLRENGKPSIIAKKLIFNATCKREMDWHLTFVVDVSGSMTESVVYSALCAAIFSELPALSVRFLAFSTKAIDFSGHVADPLTLLLEVQVGGGTHIGLGLRSARAGIRVPSRSLVVLVTDFEEGVSVGQMLAEIRTLVGMDVKCIGLAALNDSGVARFHEGNAKLAASAGMPVAAVSPEKLAQWVGDQIRNAPTS